MSLPKRPTKIDTILFLSALLALTKAIRQIITEQCAIKLDIVATSQNITMGVLRFHLIREDEMMGIEVAKCLITTSY